MLLRLAYWIIERYSRRQLRDEAQWTEDNAITLRAFMGSHTGKVLQICLTNLTIQRDRDAVMIGTPHQCGQATGYAQAFIDLQTFSAVRQPTDTPELSEHGVADFDYLHP